MAEFRTTPDARAVAGARRRRWRSVFQLALATIIASSETAVINAIFPVLRTEFDLTTAHLGLFATIGLLARTLCGPVWGILADRYGRGKVFALVVMAWSTVVAGVGLTHSYAQLLLLFSLGVIGTVAAEPIANSILPELFPEGDRGKAYGAMRAVVGFGVALRIPLFGWLAGIPGGWRAGFLGMGALQLAVGVWVFLCVKDLRGGGRDGLVGDCEPAGQFRLSDVPKLWRVRSLRLLAVNYILATSIVLLSFLPTFLVEVRGFTVQEATQMVGVMNIGVMMGALAGGPMSDRIALRFPNLGRIVLMQVYLVLFSALTALILLVRWEGEAAYYGLLLVFGTLFPIGFAGSVLPMMSAVLLPEIRSTGFGMLSSFVQGGSLMIFSLVVGVLSDRFGMPLMLVLTVTVPYAANALFWFLFYRAYPRDVADVQRELRRRRQAAAGS